MKLNATQTYEIEQHIINNRVIEAVKAYREATSEDLTASKKAITKLTQQLKKDRPWQFQNNTTDSQGETTQQAVKIRRKAILSFIIFDTLLFAGLIYWFFFKDQWQEAPPPSSPQPEVSIATRTPASVQPEKDSPLPKVKTSTQTFQIEKVPEHILLNRNTDLESYQIELRPEETFSSLYKRKINDDNYIRRKNNSSASRDYDDSLLETKIKTARSILAAGRQPPENQPLYDIPVNSSSIMLDGKIQQNEWQNSVSIKLSDQYDTTLFLQSDGQWLYIACDARDELTEQGYDQLRIYLHAGLVPEMANERLHIGKGKGVTSIRQTYIRWQGEVPEDSNQRWKKYSISDWGLYQYAAGISKIHGNRQYEAALNLGEAGIHPNIPFTLFIEVETDPQKNEQGKFVKRRYLGELGSQQQPVWFRIAENRL